jgi:archaellum component FlaC
VNDEFEEICRRGAQHVGDQARLLILLFERMERLEVTALKRLEKIMLTLTDIQNAVGGLSTSVSNLSTNVSSIGDNVTTLTTNTTTELAAIEKLLADTVNSGGTIDQTQAQALLDQISTLKANVDQAGSDIANRASDVATNATNIAAETAKIVAADPGDGSGNAGSGDGTGTTGTGPAATQVNELGGKVATGHTDAVVEVVATNKVVSQNGGNFPQTSPHVKLEAEQAAKAQQAQNLAGDSDA